MQYQNLIKRILSEEIDPAFASRAEFIINHIQQKKPGVIVDLGCGRGFYTRLCAMLPYPTEIWAVDINKKYLERIERELDDQRIHFVNASIYRLPIKSSRADLVICSEVLEHLVDDQKAMKTIYDLLRPGGIALITVPHRNYPFFWDPLNFILERVFNTHIKKTIWWLAGIWADHERLYSEKDLLKKVQMQGFEVTEVKRILRYCWPGTHFMLYALGKNIVERLGARGFDRFNLQPRPLAKILAKIMRAPQLFERPASSTDRYMDIAVCLKKTSSSSQQIANCLVVSVGDLSNNKSLFLKILL
ncbi:MAG: putative S-adenosylmethionine-dependent methyltransferase [Microgenomates bacterium OLB22]|nr:MAG: putative S-adenosylmethionine-dependent methyltransferase [Microgenomates bacterium OLB22]